MLKIMYLAIGEKVIGPLPKIDPIVINGLRKKGFEVIKKIWGRHSDQETIFEKVIGRTVDLVKISQTLFCTKPDILYISTTLDEMALLRDVPLLLVAKLSHAKKVVMMHGSKTWKLYEKGHKVYKWYTNRVIRNSDAILLLSHDEIDDWKKFSTDGNYIKVDNPFISTSDSPDKSRQGKSIPPKLLFVGRLIKEKGAFDLISAMPKILDEVDCTLDVCGVGPELDPLKDLVQSFGLQEKVSLLGYQQSKNLLGHYQTSAALVLPTYFGEGFPTVVAEAMNQGLPIITTPIRGVKDHLVEGEHVLYVEAKNIDSIANAVVRLIKDPALREKMGEINMIKVREFLPDNIIQNLVGIFQEILKQ